MAHNNLVAKIDRTIQHRRKIILGDIDPRVLIKVTYYKVLTDKHLHSCVCRLIQHLNYRKLKT